MSTLGKVLVVLVLLLIPVWIVLISANAQKNKNWEAEIEKLQQQVEQLEKEMATTQSDIVKTRDEVTQLQAGLGQTLAVRRARIAEAEQLRSATLADLARVTNLQVTSEATQKNAEENRDQRTAEVDAEKKELAMRQDDVKKLQSVNTEQMEELQQQRETFVKLQKANRAMLGQASK